MAATNALTHQVTTWYYGVTVGTDPTKGLFGQVAMVIDPNGIGHTVQYDALGRKTYETGGPVNPLTTTYNNLGGGVGVQNLRVVAGLGSEALTTTTYFDGLGRGIKREQTGPSQPTPTTIITQTEYNITGTVKRAATPRFSTDATLLWTNPQYDALGRVVRVDVPSPAGQPIRTLSCYEDWVTVTIDANNHKKRETRDAYGRLIRVDEYTGTFTTCETAVGTPYATTTYQYDVLGNLVKLTDAKGNVTTMRYDSLGRKIAMSDPDMGRCGDLTTLAPNPSYPWYPAPCWNYQYDAAGNLIQQTDAKGQHLYFQYDALNRRTQKDLLTPKALGSGDVRYLYDYAGACFGTGRLGYVTSLMATTTYCYDAVGHVRATETNLSDGSGNGQGGSTSFAYDTLGRLTRVTYPNNLEEEGIVWPSQVVYEYTGPLLKRVYELSQAYGVGEVYAQYSNYTALGQPGTVTFGNGLTTTYTYESTTARLQTLRIGSGVSPYPYDQYGYDAKGNVTYIGDGSMPDGGYKWFQYDAQDRVTSAYHLLGLDSLSWTGNYAYDEIGNLTSSTVCCGVGFTGNPFLGAYVYPASSSTSVRPHAVSTAGPNTYLYDANGNLAQGAGRKIDYDVENHPTCVATTTGACSAASTKTQFFYDGDGGRVAKKKGTDPTVFYLNQYFECVGPYAGSGNQCTKYIWANGQRIAMRNAPYATSPGQPQPAPAVSYYHTDHLGSTRAVTSRAASGTPVIQQMASYFEYGASAPDPTFFPNTVDVHYKFTGQELDETGLYDYHARLYDPVLGRFITADTMVPNPGNPQDLNRYTYARNNPLLYTDPSGHFGIIEGIIFGVVIGTVASGIQSDWDLEATIVGGVIGGVTGGVGAGVATSSVMQATLSSLGQPWAGVAGGIIAGAAAGGTGGVLASAMGYKVNIGLAIASGAAAGGIVGGAYGQWGQGGAFLAAPAAGASAAAIRGADPGVGALIAAGTAAFSLGIQYGYHEIYNYMAENGKPSVLVASGDCSPTCALRSEPTSTGSHDLQISISMGESTYSFSLFSGKVETGSTIPPSWGIGLEVSLYKPAELLAPQSLDIGGRAQTPSATYLGEYVAWEISIRS